MKLVSAILGRAGYDVVSATDGDDALRRFQEYAPDLVLLDVVLPKLAGFEVCAQLRASSEVPIIMLSAVPDDLEKAKCLQLGANDYLGKPFGIDELVARVETALQPGSC